MRTIALGVLGFVLLAGCGITVGPKELPETTFYHLDLDDPLPAARRLDIDVVVMPFSQSSHLERDGIRYRTSDVEGGYWRNHLWPEPVGDMVRGAVQTEFARSGMFSRVLLIDEAGYAHAHVTGDVVRWGEEDRADGWYAIVAIDFDVVLKADPNSMVGVEDRVVLSRRYRREERVVEQTVPEVVRALSRALSGLLADLRKDILTVVPKEES